MTPRATSFYTAGHLVVDTRHEDCDRFDGLVCGCGDCACHRLFPVGARVLVVSTTQVTVTPWATGRVVHVEPGSLSVVPVDDEDRVLGDRVVLSWDSNRGRYRNATEEVVVRPRSVVLGPDAAPAERPADALVIEVSAPRVLGSGLVVAVVARFQGLILREELVPVDLGPGGRPVPPKAERLAEVIQRAEAMGLRLC